MIGVADDPTFLDRFWAKVNKEGPGGCWLWTAATDPKSGYGKVWIGAPVRRTVNVHRAAYEALREPVPDGLVVDHLCRVRNCVNLEHLEAVTQRENLARGEVFWAITHRTGTCGKGHDYEKNKVPVNPDGTHFRCGACDREKAAARWQRIKEGV